MLRLSYFIVISMLLYVIVVCAVYCYGIICDVVVVFYVIWMLFDVAFMSFSCYFMLVLCCAYVIFNVI